MHLKGVFTMQQVYYRTAAQLVELARKCKKNDTEPEDLILEVCKRHELDDLGLLTDLNDIWIEIDRKQIPMDSRMGQRLFNEQVYSDLISKHSVRICGKLEGDRLTEVVAVNLVFAEDALRIAGTC